MNRHELDRCAAHYRLSAANMKRLFDLVHARPSADEMRRMGLRILQLGGVLSLAAGVVFFIAANWSAIGIFGHFALVQAAFVATIAIALWRPPLRMQGRLGLLGAFLLAGALLALFGQTYQTGADVYELFMMWALLGLPLAIAGRWSATWAAWLVVTNVALALFSGMMPGRAFLWILFDRWGFTEARILLIPLFVNLVLWWLSERSQSNYAQSAVPTWVRHLAVAFVAIYAAWAGIYAIWNDHLWYRSHPHSEAITWLLLCASLGAMCVYTYMRRRHVLPLMAAAGCAILLGTVAIAKGMGDSDSAVFFVMALWLIVTSTLIGHWLTYLQRQWRSERPTMEVQS